MSDVADTGHTPNRVKEFCAPHVAEVRVAVLYEKPPSVPWSADPPIVRDSDTER